MIDHNLQVLKNPPTGPSQINDIYITDWILSFPLSKPERLVAVALITNSLLLDRLHRAQISPVNNYRVQREFPRLIESQYSTKLAYVVWALLTLRNTVRFNPKLAAWIGDLQKPVTLNEHRVDQRQARYIPIPRRLVDEERLPDEIQRGRGEELEPFYAQPEQEPAEALRTQSLPILTSTDRPERRGRTSLKT